MTSALSVAELGPEGLLDAAWDDLVGRSLTPVVFLTSAWLRACHESFAGSGRLIVPVVRRDQRWVAAAAFVAQRGVVELLGTGPSDYLDLVVARELDARERALALGLILERARAATPGFRRFVLRSLPDESGTASLLRAHPYLHAVTLRSPVAPTLELRAARQALAKKSLRRKRNRLARLGPLSLETHGDAAEVLPRLDALFAMHRRRWAETPHPSLFHDPRQRLFYRRAARHLGASGALRFTELRVGSRLVAAHFGMAYAGRFTWYKPAFDPSLASASPGEVLLGGLIERALEEGCAELDFGIGDEAFKDRFATRVRSLGDLELGPDPARAHLLASWVRARALAGSARRRWSSR